MGSLRMAAGLRMAPAAESAAKAAQTRMSTRRRGWGLGMLPGFAEEFAGFGEVFGDVGFGGAVRSPGGRGPDSGTVATKTLDVGDRSTVSASRDPRLK